MSFSVLVKSLRAERALTQAELAAKSGFSTEVVAATESGRRIPPERTVRALLEAMASVIPVTEREAHDYYVAAGMLEPSHGVLPASRFSDMTRKGLLRHADGGRVQISASTGLEAPSAPLPPLVAALTHQVLALVGDDRLTAALQGMLMIMNPPAAVEAMASGADPASFTVVHPPVQKPGYTEQKISTYERVSPPGGASRSSPKVSSGE